jgi:Zn-finger domain-containing protein
MLLTNDQYRVALVVPESWTEFDARREEIQREIAKGFGEKKAKQIIKIIDYNWSDFAGETAVTVLVEGYRCLTWLVEINPELTITDIGEKVYPFDEEQRYPVQTVEQKLYFKRW